jgi:hypothetical protein
MPAIATVKEEMISAAQVHAIPVNEVITASGKRKEARNLTWSNVNFVAGTTKVLTECWGEVSIISSPFILSLHIVTLR